MQHSAASPLAGSTCLTTWETTWSSRTKPQREQRNQPGKLSETQCKSSKNQKKTPVLKITRKRKKASKTLNKRHLRRKRERERTSLCLKYKSSKEPLQQVEKFNKRPKRSTLRTTKLQRTSLQIRRALECLMAKSHRLPTRNLESFRV